MTLRSRTAHHLGAGHNGTPSSVEPTTDVMCAVRCDVMHLFRVGTRVLGTHPEKVGTPPERTAHPPVSGAGCSLVVTPSVSIGG